MSSDGGPTGKSVTVDIRFPQREAGFLRQLGIAVPRSGILSRTIYGWDHLIEETANVSELGILPPPDGGPVPEADRDAWAELSEFMGEKVDEARPAPEPLEVIVPKRRPTWAKT